MADAETVLVTALAAEFPSARVCTELPATLPASVVRVTRIGGTDDGQFSVYDTPTLDFDCFASTRAAASALAVSVRDYLRNTLPGSKVGTDAFVVSVKSVNGPIWTPYDNTDVRRFTYTAQVRIHSI